MKKLTAAALAALLLLAGCAKDDKTIDTTTATTTETTVMTTVETTAEVTTEVTETETTEITTEAEPDFSDFDINAPECLPYKLLGMTYNEILAEFGEEHIYYATTIYSEYTGAYFSIKFLIDKDKIPDRIPRGETIGLYVSTEDVPEYAEDWTFGVAWEDIKPSSAGIQNFDYLVYPGINSLTSPEEVKRKVGRWNKIEVIETGLVATYAKVNGYVLEFSWRDYNDEIKNEIAARVEGKTEEEKDVIFQEYADRFDKNPEEFPVYVFVLKIYRDGYLEGIPD